MKARDFFWIYATAYASLLAFGALNFAIPSDNALSEFIVNLLGMFVATNLVCLREYIQGEISSLEQHFFLIKSFFLRRPSFTRLNPYSSNSGSWVQRPDRCTKR